MGVQCKSALFVKFSDSGESGENLGRIERFSKNSIKGRSMARWSGVWSLMVLIFCFAVMVASETDQHIQLDQRQGDMIATGKDLFIRLDDGQSNVEKECAIFLLKARLGDTELEVPHQCQDMVRSYLEEEGVKLSVKKECASFIMNGELNNIRGWLPPPECETYIAYYMENGQYEADVRVALSAARSYLQSIVPTEGVDAVVFDIDETCLSNLPYYRIHHYGVEKFQKAVFNAYVAQSKQPVIKAAVSLYEDLQQNKWALIFITGRDEEARSYTSENLRNAGYDNWAELILRQPHEEHDSAVVYKTNRRAALEKKGYRIRASIGDQWSDLESLSPGARSFKLPNPMYYIY